MASRALLRRWVSRSLQRHAISSTAPPSGRILQGPRLLLLQRSLLDPLFPPNPRSFCSSPLNLDESQGPTTIDYRYLIYYPFASSSDYFINCVLCWVDQFCPSVRDGREKATFFLLSLNLI